MTKRTFVREDIIKDLKANAVKVFFTKVNGEKRELKCSLRPDLLPPHTVHEHLDEMHNKEENKDIIAVWDLDSGGWKSFHIDSVYYVEIFEAY
jgi:hypothetical protein